MSPSKPSDTQNPVRRRRPHRRGDDRLSARLSRAGDRGFSKPSRCADHAVGQDLTAPSVGGCRERVAPRGPPLATLT
jgi:hypothetical protein